MEEQRWERFQAKGTAQAYEPRRPQGEQGGSNKGVGKDGEIQA